MKAETKLLHRQCLAALLERDDATIAQLISGWFGHFIGDESIAFIDEDLDDLCLALGYRVYASGSDRSFGTYTAWWEVVGSFDYPQGAFYCEDIALLRSRLVELSDALLATLLDMIVDVYDFQAEAAGASPLVRFPTGAPQLASWLRGVEPAINVAGPPPPRDDTGRRATQYPPDWRTLADESIESAIARGFLICSPEASQRVRDSYRHWCGMESNPNITLHLGDAGGAIVRIHLKPVWSTGSTAVERFRQQLPELTLHSQAAIPDSGQAAYFHWLSKKGAETRPLGVDVAMAVASEAILLWKNLKAQEQEDVARRQEEWRLAHRPEWQRDLEALETARGETQEEARIPALEDTVLPNDWPQAVTVNMMRAFLNFLGIACRTRESKAVLVRRLEQCFAQIPLAQQQFGQLFKREFAIPPWDLQHILGCTRTERLRWTAEGRLVVVDLRSANIGGHDRKYPVFDFRAVSRITPGDISAWRGDHKKDIAVRRRERSLTYDARR
jgi:hypothetical protein